MLSEQSLPVVRATLPAVGAAIEDIAALFYRKLFADRPGLLRDLFNRGNQAEGTQQKALAGSVASFARLLVEQEDVRPDTLLARIAHKHASLGITPEQYELVHLHLFSAIADTLGEAVTPEVAAAWDEVYWLMAGALIAQETRLREQAGGAAWRSLRIVGRTEETPDAASLVLRRTDGRPAGTFRPGQYVSVQVELSDGAHQIRQYSLSSAPAGSDWRITVKRIGGHGSAPAGEVSTHLWEKAAVGDELKVSAPFGDLDLADGAGPLLLASAGIGITPMLSVLDHLRETGSARPVLALHADRGPADHAHRAQQRDLVAALPGARLHLWYENPDVTGDEEAWSGDREPGAGSRPVAGRMDLTALDLPEDLTAYLCGPLPFMRTTRAALLDRGVPADRVHYEVFGPDLGLDAH